ncbi:MOSC domain-containing protein [Achromobacter sp. UMC71]|uniref:MOSC domain-containing protein n=1 Tax=Achromobacter sp. UMC71 TaxID=1862320 RepID=UPI0016015201|nr:MOSC domain-containing protein [Achromobacter sp. UMC71]MBB1626081.1 molybdenum cofactor biosysynthesis protein [Achromobacter sp. UMC71]
MGAIVTAVAASPGHGFSKVVQPDIVLLQGLGVQGDAHAGVTVKHRSRVRADPTQPNLRQVHLIHGELHDALQAAGFNVAEGTLGENITTRGLDLLGLPRDACLHIGPQAVLRITGLRNPCAQLDHYQKGLTAAVLGRDAAGNLVRKAGIMAVVLQGGPVRAGDAIRVELPDLPHFPLERV